MKVRYRIVEEISANGDRETVGVIVNWPEAPAHMQVRGVLQHTVSRSIWRKIRQRAKEQQLTLERYHEALAEYGDCYRILPEIYHLQAESEAGVRRLLREKYVFSAETKPAAAR